VSRRRRKRKRAGRQGGLDKPKPPTPPGSDSVPVSSSDANREAAAVPPRRCRTRPRSPAPNRGKRLEALGDRPDPKLRLLRRILHDSPSRKVVVFSTFADSVRYLDENLPKGVDGRARVAIIGAETTPDERTKLLLRFCPESVSGTADYRPRDGEVDLLLSNDVLSEGQDLQPPDDAPLTPPR